MVRGSIPKGKHRTSGSGFKVRLLAPAESHCFLLLNLKENPLFWQNVNLADGGGGGVRSMDNWYSKGLMAFVKNKTCLKKDKFLAPKEIIYRMHF
jgi:hypothetical protein